jgi:hypothetical protein
MLLLLWRGIEGGHVDQYLDTLCDHIDLDRESTQVDAHIQQKTWQGREPQRAHNVANPFSR